VGPQLIIGSLIPHLLFSVFLWALFWLAFGSAEARSAEK